MIDGLPEAFVNRMREQLGDGLAVFLHALEEPPYRGIRINPLKHTEKTAVYTEADPIPWVKDAYYLPYDSAAGATVLHEAGAFYIQEPAAMIPAAVLNAVPGEKILDLCAAPGGKSTQIGAAMQGKGLLVCNDPIPKRAKVLSRNIERMGLPNTVVISAWPEQLAAKWPEGYDAVLVDAPCSGEGMFRRDPASRMEWSPEKAEGCTIRQQEILAAAAKLVRPGGRLIYSTCTYHSRENERNAAWFLSRFQEFHPEPFALPGIIAPDGIYTCYPHLLKAEGQFVALFRKDGEREASLQEDHSVRTVIKADRTIFESVFPFLDRATHQFGNTLVSIPELPDLNGIRVFRIGLHLGEVRGKTAVPDHAAALCCRPPKVQMTDLTSEQVSRYMSGETVPAKTEGWTLLRYAGLAIGWGKGNCGVIKNHYPKSLRGAHYLP